MLRTKIRFIIHSNRNVNSINVNSPTEFLASDESVNAPVYLMFALCNTVKKQFSLTRSNIP